MEEKRSVPELNMGEDPEAGGISTKESPGSLALVQLDGLTPSRGRPDVNSIIAEELAHGDGPIAVEGEILVYRYMYQTTDSQLPQCPVLVVLLRQLARPSRA